MPHFRSPREHGCPQDWPEAREPSPGGGCQQVSPLAQSELFSIGSATPHGGRAFGRVTASAEAATHRGFTLLLGTEATAQADVSIRDVMAASLSAGVGAKAAVKLEAAFPLDLFSEAGVVARLDASAEAAAWLRAAVGLDLHTFQSRMRARFDGVLADLCDIFLDEARVEAGLWARAAFAAEVRCELALTGALLRSAASEPGFSFSLSYGAGVGFAAGADFLVNIGLDDPGRLLNRISDRLAAEVIARAEGYAATLTGDPRRAADEALSELRMLLPLAGRTAFDWVRYWRGRSPASSAATRRWRSSAALSARRRSCSCGRSSTLA